MLKSRTLNLFHTFASSMPEGTDPGTAETWAKHHCLFPGHHELSNYHYSHLELRRQSAEA